MIRLLPCFLVLVLLSVYTSAKIDPDNLMCLVCRASLDELESSIMKIDPKKTVEVGNYRLDETGNIHQNRVPLSKSQVHLSELLDTVCKSMGDYVRVRYKATQKLAIMKMMVDGKMNSEFTFTDFVTDEDLNKSLEFYCDGIIGENEDYIVDLYSKRKGDTMPNGKVEMCGDRLKLCQDWMLPSPEDLDWTPEKQREHAEIHGSDPYGWGNNAGAAGGGNGNWDMQEIDENGDEVNGEEVDAGVLEMKEEL